MVAWPAPLSAVAVVVSLMMDIAGSPRGFARSPVGRAGPITVAFSRRRAEGAHQQKPKGVRAPPGQHRWGCPRAGCDGGACTPATTGPVRALFISLADRCHTSV